VFYDNDTKILEENFLILRKRIIGTKATLKLKRSEVARDNMYMDKLRENEREKEILAKDPLSKHFFFLNNALNSMYATALKFDPDKLFEKMKVILTIDIKRESYKVFGPGGFKAEISCENFKVKNFQTQRKNTTEFIQIKLLSGENTLTYYQDFIARAEKHCKEIFPTTDSRYTMARRVTKPLPTKEELEKLKQEKKKKEASDDDFYRAKS